VATLNPAWGRRLGCTGAPLASPSSPHSCDDQPGHRAQFGGPALRSPGAGPRLSAPSSRIVPSTAKAAVLSGRPAVVQGGPPPLQVRRCSSRQMIPGDMQAPATAPALARTAQVVRRATGGTPRWSATARPSSRLRALCAPLQRQVVRSFSPRGGRVLFADRAAGGEAPVQSPGAEGGGLPVAWAAGSPAIGPQRRTARSRLEREPCLSRGFRRPGSPPAPPGRIRRGEFSHFAREDRLTAAQPARLWALPRLVSSNHIGFMAQRESRSDFTEPAHHRAQSPAPRTRCSAQPRRQLGAGTSPTSCYSLPAACAKPPAQVVPGQPRKQFARWWFCGRTGHRQHGDGPDSAASGQGQLLVGHQGASTTPAPAVRPGSFWSLAARPPTRACLGPNGPLGASSTREGVGHSKRSPTPGEQHAMARLPGLSACRCRPPQLALEVAACSTPSSIRSEAIPTMWLSSSPSRSLSVRFKDVSQHGSMPLSTRAVRPSFAPLGRPVPACRSPGPWIVRARVPPGLPALLARRGW